MFGTLMTNTMIHKRIDDGSIRIHPYRPEQLQHCHYRLTPGRLVHEETVEHITRRKTHVLSDGGFKFQPLQYAMVVPHERIVLPDGVVGLFVPESRLIEEGFGVTTGKLDPGYGNRGEELRFGLQNNFSRENSYTSRSPLVHIQFFDVSGLALREVMRGAREQALSTLRQQENAEKREEELDFTDYGKQRGW
jgi:hypothetical protein